MIELNEKISEKGMNQGFTFLSEFTKIKGKIKDKKEYYKLIEIYTIQRIMLFFSFVIFLICSIKSSLNFNEKIMSIVCICFAYFLVSWATNVRVRPAKAKILLLEKYLDNQPNGKLEVWDFGINLYHNGKKVRDISWGNIKSINIYDDIIVFSCEIGSCSFFINSKYESELIKLLKKYNKEKLCIYENMNRVI